MKEGDSYLPEEIPRSPKFHNPRKPYVKLAKHENPNKQVKPKKRLSKVERIINSAKARSRKKSLPFDLDDHTAHLQEILDKGICQLTGIPFDMGEKKVPFSPSIDRIVPEKCYVKENIRIIVWAANCALNNWGEEVVLQVVDGIREQRKKNEVR